jgi:hypothetical protein
MNLRDISAAVVGVAVLFGATGMGHSFASSATESSRTSTLIADRPGALAASAKRHVFSIRSTTDATRRHAFSVQLTVYAAKRHAFSARRTLYVTRQPLTQRRLANTPLAFTVHNLGSKAPSLSGRARSLLHGAHVASRPAPRDTAKPSSRKALI